MEKHCCPVCGSPVGQDVCPVCGWTEGLANAPCQLQPGTILRGQFVIGRALGQERCGITYLGWDRKQERTVAIKEFFPVSTVARDAARGADVQLISADAGKQFEDRRIWFLREAQALAGLSQTPGIVCVYGCFLENGTAYMVMEYVRGSSLEQYTCRAGGRLSVEETLRILKPILLSMDKLHQRGILHRDISPDNIILDPMGGARLLNFCGARDLEEPILYRDGFAALELYQTRNTIGPWSDEYALCATVYFCLTGQVPPHVTSRILEEAQPDWEHILGLTEDQRRVLQKGMSTAVRDRYPSVGELCRALFRESPLYIPVPQPEPPQPEPPQPEPPKPEPPKPEPPQPEPPKPEPPKPEPPQPEPPKPEPPKPEPPKPEPPQPEPPQPEPPKPEPPKPEPPQPEPPKPHPPQPESPKQEPPKPGTKPAKKKSLLKWLIPTVAAVLALGIGIVVWAKVIRPAGDYKAAQTLLDSGQYARAAEAFEALGTYQDSAEKLAQLKGNVRCTYKLNSTGLTITGFAGAYPSKVTLPTVIDGKLVTRIGQEAFGGCADITRVAIPCSVASVEDRAFYGCTGLTSVTIADGAASIGECAFSGCTSLASVTIPGSVASIGKYVFEGCTELSDVTIADGVASIGEYAFSGCTGLASVTIPGSVTSIGKHLFNGCTGLTGVTIGDGVTSIDDYAFYGCTGLTGVAIPGSVTSIGKHAFTDCTGLTEVTIAEGVTSIENRAFSGCTRLRSVTMPDSVTHIGEYAFADCTSLTGIAIPGGVTSIEHAVFSGCIALTDVTIPDSVTFIRYSAFSGCTSLTGVTIPRNCKVAGNAFPKECIVNRR